MRRNSYHIRRIGWLYLILVSMLAGWFLSAGSVEAISMKNCHPSWKQVGSDDFWFTGSYLTAVAATSTTDAWAVGGYDPLGGSNTTGILHWTGGGFGFVNNPNPGLGNDYLNGVAAIASNDAWTVGSYEQYGNTPAQTLIEHWDGTQWSVVTSPNNGTNTNILLSISALSATDIWAVGYYWDSNKIGHTMTQHWDGTSWSIVPSPNNGADVNVLNAVTAVSSNDVWAVGYYNPGNQSLTEHWDGTSWSIVSSPNAGALRGVAAISSNDVWAVAGAQTEHWDGTAWSIVPGAINAGSAFSVAATSSKSVWAAGLTCCGPYYYEPFIEHWNGSKWRLSLGPSAAGYNQFNFNGIGVVPNSQDVFAVGVYNNSEGYADTVAYEYAC